MKAYRGADGKIRLFRPMENMNRLKRSVAYRWVRGREGGADGQRSEGGVLVSLHLAISLETTRTTSLSSDSNYHPSILIM